MVFNRQGNDALELLRYAIRDDGLFVKKLVLKDLINLSREAGKVRVPELPGFELFGMISIDYIVTIDYID